MKKLVLLTVGVAIVLVGFMAVLYCLPCKGECCDRHDRCEMKDGDGKCSEHEGCKDGDEKCSDEHHEGCMEGNEKCSGHHEGCENGKTCPMEQGGCKMEGMEHNGCSMQMGNSCNMQMGHGCCCCCMMMMMNGCHMEDSAKSDSVHMKVRGKL